MARDTSARRRQAAELRLPTARLTLIRIWSVVGAIVIAATVLNVLGVLSPVIEFLAVGSLIAFVESPIVNGLEHRGVPRGLGALIGLIVVIAIIACVVMVVVPMFFEQCLEILSNLPAQLRELGTLITSALQRFRSFSQGSWALDIDSVFASLANIVQVYGKQIAGDLGKGMLPFITAIASQFFVVFFGLGARLLACLRLSAHPSRDQHHRGRGEGDELPFYGCYPLSLYWRLYARHGYHVDRWRLPCLHGLFAYRPSLRLAHGGSYGHHASRPRCRSLGFCCRIDDFGILYQPLPGSLDLASDSRCAKYHR